MAKIIPPRSFGLRQKVRSFAPWLVMLLITCAVFVCLFRLIFSPTWANVISFVLTIFVLSSGSLGYAAWNISQLRAGLVSTPKRRWHVQPAEGGVAIDTSICATVVPAQSIESVSLVMDDSWEQLRGMETTCLVLHLRGGGRIAVPGSSEGFDGVLSVLRSSHPFSVVSV
jgi:hypothetical protein